MATSIHDLSSPANQAFRVALIAQLKGEGILGADELSLFEWYACENSKLIDQMLTEERAFIKEQIDAGLEDINDSGILAVEYYTKRVRYAHVIYMTSLLETYLAGACERLMIILGGGSAIFRPDELAGDKWSRRKKFLERYGGLTFPGGAWSELQILIGVRNILVHENGSSDSISHSERTRILQRPGVAIDQSELVIENEYIEHCLSAFRALVESITRQIDQVPGMQTP